MKRVMGRHLRINRSNKRIKIVLFIILTIIILEHLLSIWFSYNWLTVSYFTVIDNKISEAFRIVLISDLHDHEFGNDNKSLVEEIREQLPDLIVVDGDILNKDSENDETAVNLVHSLVEIAPVYYSFGNHEYSYIEAGHGDLRDNLEVAGAVILNYQIVDIEVNGNKIRLGGLYEYGFETVMQSEKENEQAISYLVDLVDTDRYLIMCAHRPESFWCWGHADKWGLDLVLSGHLHGGQVIIPGVGGLYSSLEEFFPTYDYGQYRVGDSDMIITRGLGSNQKMLPRFNNSPEIAVVDVVPEQQT